MAYTFKYRIEALPQASQDGSGMIMHDVDALVSSDAVNYSVVPGRHKTVCVPSATLQTALASGTNNQKVTAYKNALAANLDTVPTSVQGWDQASLTALMTANDAAAAVLVTITTFITVTLHQTFPIDLVF